MKKRKISALVVLGLLLFAPGVIAFQRTWKGMLLAEPGLTALTPDKAVKGLTGFKVTSIIVEEIPEPLRDSLSVTDVEHWTTNRLQNAGIRVVTTAQQKASLLSAPRNNDEQALARSDRFYSSVSVVLNFRESGDRIYGMLMVICNRGAFVVPGAFAACAVWHGESVVSAPKSLDWKAGIREGLNQILDDLEKDWKSCNP